MIASFIAAEKERRHLGAAHAVGVPELMEPDECDDPSQIGLFGPVGVVQRSDLRSDLIQEFHA